MPYPDFIPRKDVDFNLWSLNLVSRATERKSALHIPDEAIEALTAEKNNWTTRYQLSVNPETRTKAAVAAKQEARESFEAALRRFVKEYIRNNHYVTVSDLEIFGLHPYKETRTRAGIPTTYPEMEVDTSVLRHLIIHLRDRLSVGKARPEGVRGIELVYGIVPEGATPSIDELRNSVSVTRSPVNLTFGDRDRGMTVSYAARWDSTRGEKGPWSEIEAAIIP
jgi:hypothetical protein